MSLHYIIDGYNAVYKIDSLKDNSLRNKRDALIGLIERHEPQGSLRNEVTVVFDGKPEVSGCEHKGQINVLFSKNESADEKIKKIVEKSSNPKRIVIVSDDRQVIYYCRSLGAKVKSVAEFFGFGHKKNKFSRDEAPPDKPALDPDTAKNITDQLKNLWLKED
ncbi:MAG: NYN domain-containing protein [Candidatus Omnitrophica bacterium]|nr:NYN domain-containing protein [Candidatus Omnitrophota bacterium]